MTTTATATRPTPTASDRNRVPALNRPTAIVGSVLAALLVNLIIWAIGAAAGGSFEMVTDGQAQTVGPGGVALMTAVPLLAGTTTAALIAYRWIGVLRTAEVVGSVLALATIAGTLTSGFDTASTIALSLMHVTLVPILIGALEGLRRGITAR